LSVGFDAAVGASAQAATRDLVKPTDVVTLLAICAYCLMLPIIDIMDLYSLWQALSPLATLRVSVWCFAKSDMRPDKLDAAECHLGYLKARFG
jgi:hypothetical protein